jgi:hypothetical protein
LVKVGDEWEQRKMVLEAEEPQTLAELYMLAGPTDERSRWKTAVYGRELDRLAFALI